MIQDHGVVVFSLCLSSYLWMKDIIALSHLFSFNYHFVMSLVWKEYPYVHITHLLYESNSSDVKHNSKYYHYMNWTLRPYNFNYLE